MKKFSPEFWLQLMIIVGGCFSTAIILAWNIGSHFTVIDNSLVLIRTTQLSVLSEQKLMKEEIIEIKGAIATEFSKRERYDKKQTVKPRQEDCPPVADSRICIAAKKTWLQNH